MSYVKYDNLLKTGSKYPRASNHHFAAKLNIGGSHILAKKHRQQAFLHDQVDRMPTQINYIKPLGQKMAELLAPFRKASLPVILHSDGQVQAITPDLVERV